MGERSDSRRQAERSEWESGKIVKIASWCPSPVWPLVTGPWFTAFPWISAEIKKNGDGLERKAERVREN